MNHFGILKGDRMKNILTMPLICLLSISYMCQAEIPYEGVGHDFASYQPMFTTDQHSDTMNKFLNYAKTKCPKLYTKIQAQLRQNPASRLWYVSREGSGRGQAIRQDTIDDCQSE
jgi:hypothetical protein